jgi:hypothetical protein
VGGERTRGAHLELCILHDDPRAGGGSVFQEVPGGIKAGTPAGLGTIETKRLTFFIGKIFKKSMIIP